MCAAERSSSPPDEVDATGKNKFQSLSIILSRRQPIQKALNWADPEMERSPQVSNAWHGKRRSSFPPDEVDATDKNKSKSWSSILSGRQPSQKALDWVDQETERSPQVSHTWCGKRRFMLRLMWCRLLKDEVLLQMRQMKQAETSLKAYWVFEQEAAKSKGSGLSGPGDG